jgi:hypothetical protein
MFLAKNQNANPLTPMCDVPGCGWIERVQESELRPLGVESTDGLEARAHREDAQFSKSGGILRHGRNEFNGRHWILLTPNVKLTGVQQRAATGPE